MRRASVALESSLAQCTVRDGSGGGRGGGGGVAAAAVAGVAAGVRRAWRRFPPCAHVNSTPYANMVESFEASYANFRFYSEVLLADVMPREIERLFLEYHNARGGRLGGASRWQDHLDDMPTAGWGYGALTNNRTDDVLALLYGHMASYQSHGAFHSTEQLSFLGEGLYRAFLHVAPQQDPMPAPNLVGPVEAVEAEETHVEMERRAGGQYYALENDVSFCIVSEVLVARLTRWHCGS